MTLKSSLQLVASILICEFVGIAGSLFTFSSVNNWYTTLATPALNPPGWVFGPVWTLLYALMGIAVFLIWQKRTKRTSHNRALAVFAAQLVLNGIWTPIFFGAHNLGLAFIDIVLLLLAIVWPIVEFYKISRPAAYLLLPYAAWVSFATYLNLALWLLN